MYNHGIIVAIKLHFNPLNHVAEESRNVPLILFALQAFEAQFGPTWQCAVGDHFGSCVHHRSAEYVEVAMPRFSVLLYRCIETPKNRVTATASPSMSPESR